MTAEAFALVDEDLVVRVAQEICSRPSPRPEELATALYLADELERLGFEVELTDVVKDRPNVVAIARGEPEYQSFVFNGHTDMPNPTDGWKRDPYQPWIEDGVLYGGGLQDMKGGVAALVAGAAAARAHRGPRGDIVVALTMHHDTIGLGTKYFLASCRWRLDAGICGEPTNLKVQLSHGGAWDWEIETRGVVRHQSSVEEGVNAITGMVRIVQQIDTSALSYTPDPRYPYLPRVVVGTIAGGGRASFTADRCIAQGDVRYLPSMTIDQMQADLQRIVDRVCVEMPGLSGRVRTLAYQRPYTISEDDPMVQRVIAAHQRVTGAPPELSTGLPAGAFITDAADMIRHGIPTVLYGPGLWQTEPNEGVPIADLVTAARVYAATCVDTVTQLRR